MSEYYAVQRSDEYLAHYGIKGMKWGVKKAIERGNDRALSRQYRKAQKKLAKLEKRANNGSKYAKRAAAYGVGAAAAGGLAIAGTGGVARGIKAIGETGSRAATGLGKIMTKSNNKVIRTIGAHGSLHGVRTGSKMITASGKLNKWGNGRVYLSENAAKGVKNMMGDAASKINKYGGGNVTIGDMKNAFKKVDNGVSRNTLIRAGSAALGAGLGIAAGRNAYKAATAKRFQKKAAQFRAEMNKTFAGTKYANGAPRHKKKK